MAEYPTDLTTFADSDVPTSDGFVVFGNIFDTIWGTDPIVYAGDYYHPYEPDYPMYGWRYYLIGRTMQNIETGYFKESAPRYPELSGSFRFEVD